jgi:predicted Zn-dependent peptidase
VANQSLGGGASSRLFHVLREERGLTYGAYSSLSPRLAAGHFGASIDCRTEVTQEALSGLLGLIRRFAEEGPTAEEHRRSQKYLLGSFTLARETPGAIVQDEVGRLLHGLPEDEWVTWRGRVGAVSREEALGAARDLFDPGTGILAAVGDAAVIRPVLEGFGETTLWDADGPRSG